MLQLMKGLLVSRKNKVPINMAIGNVEFMHECFPKRSRMGTARMKYDKETEGEDKKRDMSRERSKVGTKGKKSRRPITT